MSSQQPALALFVIGLMGLGLLALIHGDFALVWQPVPTGVPARTAIAYATGLLMIGIAVGLLFEPSRPIAVRVLLPYLLVWSLLKLPDILQAPGSESSWLGLGELTLLLSGGAMLFARLGALSSNSRLGFLAGERGARIATVVFGLSIIPIGLSHIVYLQQTVEFVPSWLPFRSALAVITGAGQIASGLGVLFGVLPSIAAWAEAGQTTLYTLLVWLPKLLTGEGTRLNWTAFFVSWILTAAAWVVAQNVMAARRSARLAL
jgi:uncharacterized membrane protein